MRGRSIVAAYTPVQLLVKRRRVRMARRITMVTALVVFFSVATPPNVVPPGQGFPTSWFDRMLAAASAAAWADPGDAPKQQRGKKGSDDHYVSLPRMTANPKPKKIKGELADYAPRRAAEGKRVAGAQGEGFNSRTSERIPSAAGPHSDVFANSDGSYTRRVHVDKVNYKADDGSWRPINNNLRRDGNGRLTVTASSLGVSFAATAGGADVDLVRLTVGDGGEIAYGLDGATIAEPVVSGPVATYFAILPQVDLELEVQPSAAKETLVLRSASAPTEYVFPLRLKGLTARLAEDGHLEFVDSRDDVVASIPLGFMEDAKVDATGSGALSYGMTYELIAFGGESALKMTLDGDWLRDPARIFPVRVDPTTTVADTTNDTYVQSDSTTNRVGEDNVATGTFNGGATKVKALLPFPAFTTTFAGKRVSAAGLNLFMSYQGINTGCYARRFDVYPVTQSWSPGNLAYSSFPTYGASIGNASPSSSAACNNQGKVRNVGTWVRVTLSVSALNGWVTGGNNYGLALSAASLTDNTAWKRFTSANPNLICNHATYNNIQCDPFIDVTYTDNTVPQIDERYPANNAVVNSLTPELVAAGHDADSWPAKGLRYNFFVYTSAGTQISTSGWLTNGLWKVPAGILTWNQTYLYTVQINDYSSTGPPALNPYAFTTIVPQATVTSALAQNGGKGFEPNVGNYTTSDTDAQVPTVGPALSITRDYNSLDTRVGGAFGRSWSSILDMEAAEAVDASGALQTVTVRYPNGQEIAFGRNPTGAFVAPLGRFSVFKAISGGYSLTDKNATKYEFTRAIGSGRYAITNITDASGRVMTFQYDTNGRVDQMRSVSSNRQLTFDWSQPPNSTHWHVTSVTTDPVTPGDPLSAQTWTYSYDNDKLQKACPPSSTTNCTTYTYSLASQHQSAVMNTAPYGYWRLNEPAGATTALSTALSNSGSDAATPNGVSLGAPGGLAYSTSTSAAFDGTSSSITLPAKPAQRSAYQSISLWFKTSIAGGVLYSLQAAPVSAGATSTLGYNPVLYIGTDGKLRGQLATGAPAAALTSTRTVTDDQWHHVALAGNGTTQTLYLDGIAQGVALGGTINLYTSSLTNAYLGAGFVGGAWPAQPYPGDSTAHAWFFNGAMADVAYYSRAITAREVAAMHAAGSSGTAELASVTSPGGRQLASITYSSVTGRVDTVTDENGGTWQVGDPAASGSSQVYVSSVLGSQPVDYWRLGDIDAPTHAVNVIKGNTATYQNVTFDTTQPNTTSPFSDTYGAVFNGTSSFVTLTPGTGPTADSAIHNIPNSDDPASIELWFRVPAGTATSGVLYAYQDNEVNGSTPTAGAFTPALYVGADGYLRGDIRTAAGINPIVSTKKVNDGTWHYAVLASKAGPETDKQTLYLDNVLIGTKSHEVDWPDSQYAYIGAGSTLGWPSSSGAVSYFTGNIAEFAYHDHELSAAEVDAHFRASRSVVQPGQQTTGSTLTPVSVVSITDPTNKISKKIYDVVNGNRLIASTDTLGNTTTYGYDIGGFRSVVYDPIGQKTVTGRDVRGNTITTTTCQYQASFTCNTTYYSYWPDATTTNLTPDGRNDQLTDIRSAQSVNQSDNTRLTHFDYDAAGNRTKMTSPPVLGFPAGRTTTITYTDAATVAPGGGTPPPGLPRQVTSAGGAVQTTEYYATGDVYRVTDPGGLITEFTYDGLGRMKTKIVMVGGTTGDLTTTYAYDVDGQLVQQVDPPVLNDVTGATHTATTTSAYDWDGNVTSRRVDDSLEGGDTFREVSSDYDSHGRMVKAVDPIGNVTLFEYDLYGNKTRTIACASDPTPQVTCPGDDILRMLDNTWDSEGHQLDTTLTGEDGMVTRLSHKAYYPTGELASDTDSMDWVTKYTYNNAGEPETISRFDGTTTYVLQENTYYNNELVVSEYDNGARRQYVKFDAAGRLIYQEWMGDGFSGYRYLGTTYTYDGDDHVTITRRRSVSMDGPGTKWNMDHTIENSYDAMGRVLTETTSPDPESRPRAWLTMNDTATYGPFLADVAYDSSGAQFDFKGHKDCCIQPRVFSRDDGALLIQKLGRLESGQVLDTTKSYTMSAWVKFNSFNATGVALAANGDNNRAALLQYDKTLNKWTFAAAGSDVVSPTTTHTVSSGSSLTANTWVLLTGTFDAGTQEMKLYVNGSLAGSTTNLTPWEAKGHFSLGGLPTAGSSATTDSLDGAIDNVQLYQRALSAADIASLNAAGRSGTTTSSVGQLATTYTVDGRGLTSSKTDLRGHTTQYTYNANGQLSTAIAPPAVAEAFGGPTPLPAVAVTRYGYNTFGERTETQDPLTNVITTRLDANGRPIRTTLPDYSPPGGTMISDAHTAIVYDGLGQVVSSTDPLDHNTTYEYDSFGNVSSVTGPTGKVSTAKYDGVGDLIESIDPTGAKTTATYDLVGRIKNSSVVVRQSGQTNTTTYGYGTGVLGTSPWLQSVTTPDGVVTTKTYDSFGNPITATDGAGNTTSFSYDGMGRLTTTTYPDLTQSQATYDGLGRVIRQQNLDSSGVALTNQSATYDGNGNLTSSTDARQTKTEFTYDERNRLVAESQPQTTTASIGTSFGYDMAGNLTRFTDGRANEFWTTYNTWGLPESQIEPWTAAHPDVVDRTFRQSYDAKGRPVVQLLPGEVLITDSYDNLDRLVEQSGTNAEVPTSTRTFDYDDAGRLTSFSVPGGMSDVSYDDRSLMLSVTGPYDSSSFTYTRDGLVASRTDAAGTTGFTYDSAGRLKTATNAATGIDLDVTAYNELSQPTMITHGGTGGNVRTFGYDSLHRLWTDTLKTSSGASTLSSITYGYDVNSNVTSKVTTGFAGGGVSNSYTYDLADRLTSWTAGTTTTAYAYDDSGNRTQNGAKTFTYDARNRLMTQGGTTNYQYSPRGTLLQTTTASGTSSTMSDAFGQVVSQSGLGGTATYSYDAFGRAVKPGVKYSGLGNTLAQDADATYTRGPSGSVIGAGVGAGAGSAYALTDLHDDVVGQFTATGTALAGSATYDPLGLVVASGSLVGNLGYQSEWTETATGRVNMHARWYNTDTGQFDTRDTVTNSPVPDSVDANRYQYANANPLINTDPSGHGIGSWLSSKVTSFNNTYIKPAVSTFKAVASTSASALTYVASGRAWNDVKAGYRWAKDKITNAYTAVKDATVRWAKDKLNKVKDAYTSAKSCVSQGVGKCVKETAKKAIKSAIDTAKSTAQALKEDPLKFLATVGAAAVAAVAVGALCATGIGCLLLAGAVVGAATAGSGYMVDVARGDQNFSWHGFADSVVTGSLDGLLSGGLNKFGGLGGKIFGGGGKPGLGGRSPFGKERTSGGGGHATTPRTRSDGGSTSGGDNSATGSRGGKANDNSVDSADEPGGGGRDGGTATGGDEWTRVGRWMHPDEHSAMLDKGTVQWNDQGTHRVANPATPTAYRNAPAGDIYVDYEVPTAALRPHSEGTSIIYGPNSLQARLPGRAEPGEVPFRNISNPR